MAYCCAGRGGEANTAADQQSSRWDNADDDVSYTSVESVGALCILYADPAQCFSAQPWSHAALQNSSWARLDTEACGAVAQFTFPSSRCCCRWLCSEAARSQQQQRQPQQESSEEQMEEGDMAVDWTNSPEHAGAIVVHHETILKLKRILLTYM